MTGNAEDAEDVVQESFLRAYRQLDKFDERASFGTWMYRIAANCSLDLVRLRKRRNQAPVVAEGPDESVPELPSLAPSPERIALSGEVRERLAAAMNELLSCSATLKACVWKRSARCWSANLAPPNIASFARCRNSAGRWNRL